MPPRLSRSKALWEMRAEQVMDKVFSQGETKFKLQPIAGASKSQRQQPARTGLLIGTSAMALLGLGSSLWLAQNWQRSLQTLNRERNLQMIERLRQIPVDSTAQGGNAENNNTKAKPTTENEAKPTDEADAAQAELEPLTLPLAGTVPVADTSLSAADTAAITMPAEPLLVGVVHAGGGKGSAIFQLDQLSLSAAPGDAIGNSGWNLHSVQANGAVIERDGQQRSLSVGGAF